MIDMTGLDRLRRKLDRIENLQAMLLVPTMETIIEEDNRRGVLAGLDKDGRPMTPVTYRPKGFKKDRIKIGSPKSQDLRNGAAPRSRSGAFVGLGPAAAGLNNSLSTKEYQKLAGPPLAPRRQFSRVVTNLRFGHDFDPSGRVLTIYGYWAQVVSSKGVKFLSAHFQGKGRLPVRNLAGLRPEGRAKARRAFVAWASDQIRVHLRGAA